MEELSFDPGLFAGLSPRTPNVFDPVAFRKKIYLNIEELQADLDDWMERYNKDRTHQGKRCQGKTPFETFLNNLPQARAKMYDNLSQAA